MSNSKFVNPTKVITGICTFSYLNCWEPKAIEGGKPKFSVSLVIPKSDTKTVERIRAAIQAAYLLSSAAKFGCLLSVSAGSRSWLPSFVSVRSRIWLPRHPYSSQMALRRFGALMTVGPPLPFPP